MKDESLKLALEALENCTTWHLTREQFDKNITAIKVVKQALALDKMAENARELGLDYEPVPENFIDALRFDTAVRDVDAMIALARADEREACAKVCDDFGPSLANGAMLSEAIRARGNA
jgi:hypothetical protein